MQRSLRLLHASYSLLGGSKANVIQQKELRRINGLTHLRRLVGQNRVAHAFVQIKRALMPPTLLADPMGPRDFERRTAAPASFPLRRQAITL